MQLNVLRDLGAEREPQMDASVREIRRDALSNDIHFLHAQMQASHVRPTRPAPISGIDHVDHHVGPRIHDADVVSHDEIAVVFIVWEEGEYGCRNEEQMNVARYPPADMVIKVHIPEARTVNIERLMQPLLILATQLHSCVLDLGVALSYALLQAPRLLVSARHLRSALIGS